MTSIFKTMFAEFDARKRARATAAEYERVFATPAGRRVLADILRRAGVTKAKMYRSERVAALHDGRESLALEILRLAGAEDGRLAEALIADRLEEMTDDDRIRADADGGAQSRADAGTYAGAYAGAQPDADPIADGD